MIAKKECFSIDASVQIIDKKSRELLRSYTEVVIHVLKKFISEQAIVGFGVAISRYMQLSNMTP